MEYHRGEALRASSVERFLHAARAEPCRRIRRSVGLDTLLAELGDDGVYHLSFLGKLCCGECASHLEQAGTDNAELYRTTCDPTRVPPRQRCPEFPLWPPYRGAKTIGSVRATLIDTLGLRCHCCQSGFGSFVDHDHFTGIVRGLVCADCNSQVDKCRHLSGCPFADYLNDPPAEWLGTRYPGHRPRRGSSNRTTIELLGIDPFSIGWERNHLIGEIQRLMQYVSDEVPADPQ